MNYFTSASRFISSKLNINRTYLMLIIKSLFILLIVYVFRKILIKLFSLIKNNKRQYMFTKILNFVLYVFTFLILIFIWDSYIKSFMTLISLISAAVTIALREIIFNFFCGIYISVKKPFSIEDRIEFDNIKGDVINISSLYFELLEVDDSKNNGQSTGKIITVPNSFVFTKSIKNYNKAFKYIWYEINIKVPFDCNLKRTKQELYRIVNSIETIKKIPNKMKNQIRTIGTDYRIYFNQLEPMIYTKVLDDCIELDIRYLIHPKKSRFVESIIWNKILELRNNNIITLYEKK